MKHDERKLTIAIADYLTLALPPEVVWTHFPAGELRTTKTGALLKRMGLKPGVPDFLLWWKGKAYAIEVKVLGGRTSTNQLYMIDALICAGVHVCIVHRFEGVPSFLKSIGMKLKAKVA